MSKKKSNIKIYVTFALVMLVCFAAGFGFGSFAGKLEDMISSISWPEVAKNMYLPTSIVFVVETAVAFSVSLIIYKKNAEKYKSLEAADDDVYELEIMGVEVGLSNSLLIGTVTMLFNFFLYALCICLYETLDANMENEPPLAGLILAEIALVATLVFYMTLAAYVVKLEKRINPEKKGNVFDLHFTKKWLGSMDEAELMRAARGAQKAYYAGTVTGMILWVISLASMLVFHTGIMPFACISAMLIVMVIAAEVNSR